MKNIIVTLAVIAFSQAAFASPVVCTQNSVSASNSNDQYRLILSGDHSLAQVLVNGVRANFGTLACYLNSTADAVNCHSKNVADAGYSAYFSLSSATANLYQISFIGSSLVAGFECSVEE